jgi:hypothetical protein
MKWLCAVAEIDIHAVHVDAGRIGDGTGHHPADVPVAAAVDALVDRPPIWIIWRLQGCDAPSR